MINWDIIRKRIKECCEKKGISLRSACLKADVTYPNVHRFVSGKRAGISLEVLSKLANIFEVPVGYFIGEVNAEEITGRKQNLTKEVHFVKPKILYNGSENIGPVDEDYYAIPLVSDAGAGISGIIPQEEIKSWILVYSPALPARISQNLLAVRIAENEFSMVPVLHPGDIILVDRQDFIPEEGGIYLVRLAEPDWPISVKRVNLIKRNGHIHIVFSSDNPDKKTYPPMIYDFKDYDEDFGKAIIGRVVWAWSDMTKK